PPLRVPSRRKYGSDLRYRWPRDYGRRRPQPDASRACDRSSDGGPGGNRPAALRAAGGSFTGTTGSYLVTARARKPYTAPCCPASYRRAWTRTIPSTAPGSHWVTEPQLRISKRIRTYVC